MDAAVFTDLDAEKARAFGHQPLVIGHRLHREPLFDLDALARLIERYPREHYALVHMGAQGGRRQWQEGTIGSATGEQVIAAIAAGRMWLNLRRVLEVESAYRRLVEAIFRDLEGKVPGLDTFAHAAGILISSPGAQVYYHFDLPGQSLWQIHGRKRVYVYPAEAPFLQVEDLERVALDEVEVDVPYDPAFDAAALVHDLAPGEMMHWPLNAPHRVENHDCLNVSMTVEYFTEEIRRRQMVNLANAVLRHRFGVNPTSRATSGPGFYAKAVLQKVMRQSGWLKRRRQALRTPVFTLDPERPGGILPLAQPG